MKKRTALFLGMMMGWGFTGCQETKPVEAIKPPPWMAWQAKFGAMPALKNPEVLPIGQTLSISSGDVVDRHLSRVQDGWVFDFDLLGGEAGRPLHAGEAEYVVASGKLRATRGPDRIRVFEDGLQVAEFAATSPIWGRGVTARAAMAFDGSALWVVTHNQVLRWTSGLPEGKPAVLHTYDHPFTLAWFGTNHVALGNGVGWSVVRPDGVFEVEGGAAVWASEDGTKVFRKIDGLEVASRNDLTFGPVMGSEEIDGVFPSGDRVLGQWWSADPSWEADFAEAAWLEGGAFGARFSWGASWPLSVVQQNQILGLSPLPAARWRHGGETSVTLESAASGAIFYDGATIVRRHENVLQRIPEDKLSTDFPLRLVRQIVCHEAVCLVLGRDGALDQVDVKTKTRKTVLFVHPGESFLPVLRVAERATVLCEPRCVTSSGAFVRGVVEVDLGTQVATQVFREDSKPRSGWIAERRIDFEGGVAVAVGEPERESHKVGRPPRFSVLDLEGLTAPDVGDFSKPREFVVGNGRALVATSAALGGFGAMPFQVDVAGAYNLVSVGDEVWHLAGRGADCRLVVRDGATGAVKREQPMAGVSAFGIAGAKMMVGLEDGRLVLSDR